MRAIGWLLITLFVGAAVGGIIVFPRFEGEPPVIDAPSEILLSAETEIVPVTVSDSGTGLSHVVVRIDGRDEPLLERRYQGGLARGTDPLEISLDAKQLGLSDGEVRLTISARDAALRDGFEGNLAEHSIVLRVDTEAPVVRVESGLTYVYRGGSAVVTYRVDELPARDGIAVGDVWFRGYPAPGPAAEAGWQRRVAFFALPVEGPESPAIEVLAFDAAGNRAAARFPVRTFERRSPDAPIRLSDRFLAEVVPRLAEARGIDTSDPVRAFADVNSRIRAEDEARIREIVEASASERFHEGRFEQLKGSKATSRFAERRRYLYRGREVSTAIHYGFDLASTSAAPITAANTGVVLFGGDLGIYGQCVILDHGLGVTTLYGHLSRIDVGPGDRVARGEPIGLTGATGLAGGDHLHFAVLIGPVYVDPLEWWDPKWVRSHIETRLESATR